MASDELGNPLLHIVLEGIVGQEGYLEPGG